MQDLPIGVLRNGENLSLNLFILPVTRVYFLGALELELQPEYCKSNGLLIYN